MESTHVPCPKCGKVIEVCSDVDAGSHDYRFNSVPVEVALAINEETNKCPDCHTPLRVTAFVSQRVMVTLTPFMADDIATDYD